MALSWDPLSNDYLLVSNAHSGVRLIDSVSLNVIMCFKLPSKATKVKTLAWVTSAPGMFITGGEFPLFNFTIESLLYLYKQSLFFIYLEITLSVRLSVCSYFS